MDLSFWKGFKGLYLRMADIIYRCPECGGLLKPVTIDDAKLLQCEGCTALYEPTDKILLKHAYYVNTAPHDQPGR